MARKTKEESQKTRDQILDAAERVFLARGVAHTTMNDIAAAAGVSRGAVYGHYGNKIEVCLAMTERALQDDRFGLLPPQASPLEALAQAGLYYLRQSVDPSSLQRVWEILYSKCERSEEHRPILRWRKLADRMTMLYIRRQLKAAIAQGELPADLDLRLASLYLCSVLDGLFCMLKWAYEENVPNAMADSERMVRATLAALGGMTPLRHAPVGK
ncbi:TetR family transcriptional regulator [Xenophilus sp. AP218F]|nr:TetR family transcriptional regulator [Xenophilus sp. AP218F]